MEFKNTKKNKIENIEELSQKFDKSVKQDKSIQLTQKSSNNQKRNYTLYLSTNTINELEEFLKDFGEFKETKSSFIENAIEESIRNKKEAMKTKLLDKIRKLEE